MKPITNFILILLILVFSGCAINDSKDIVTYEKDGVKITYESSVGQALFLYFTKAKQIKKESGLSSLSVGEIESISDPNSIKALPVDMLPLLF